MRKNKDFITLAEAAEILPRRTQAYCVWRWCRKGTKARNGQQIYLKHERWGGIIYTTQKWLDDFAERLAAADIEYFKNKTQCRKELP